MPTYEYQCEKCNQTFEVFQSMKDEPFAVCPQKACRLESWGQGKVKRLLGTGAGLIFKGSGFYTTDYRSSNYKESAKKESGPPKEKEGGPAKTEGTKAAPEKSSGSSGEGSSTGSTGSTSSTGSSNTPPSTGS